MTRPRPAGQVALWALALCMIVGSLAVFVAMPPDAGAEGPGYAVTVTPTTDLGDGKQMTVNVKAFDGTVIYHAFARVCRAGVAYQLGDDSIPNADFADDGPNCPMAPVSSSASTMVESSSTYRFAGSPEGDSMYLRAGVGVVNWTYAGTPQSLTCDAQNPCALVVQLLTGPVGQAPVYTPVVFDLTYADTDPVASCGGGAPGVLSSAGSDALSDAWINWTLGTCRARGAGAPTTMTFQDETLAVNRVASGDLDLAYTGVGYDAEAGFLNLDNLPGGPRPVVAVPVALDAAVLAVGNGWTDPNINRKRPYGPLALTLDEATAMVAGGDVGASSFIGDIGQRNPELTLPGVFSTAPLKVAGPSEGGTTPWLVTRYLAANRGNLWSVPNTNEFTPDSGRPRGVDASLALADPTYNRALTLLTGRPGLRKELGRFSPQSDGGGAWFLTDLSTALAYDLQPVALGSADGSTFVAPEVGSMSAAADAMTPNESGVRIPAAVSSAGYPLTYVVYAIVPAQPLTDASGACRTESQTRLAEWLDYVVHDGQQALPAGLAPLTTSLRADAESALQQVGQTPGDPCPVPSPNSPVGDPDPPPPGSPTGASTAALAGSSGRGPASGASSSAEVEGLAQANTELAMAGTDVPTFLGATLPSILAAVLALGGIGALTAAAARQTSKRGVAPGAATVEDPDP